MPQKRAPSEAGSPQCWQTGTNPVGINPTYPRRGTLRHRSVAIVTRDPSLYHELAGFLRERRWSAVSLLPGERIPETVAVVLTSTAEAGAIAHPRVLEVTEGGDRRALGVAVARALTPSASSGELVVGIDPGPRPGYAVLEGSECVGEGNLDAPEGAAVFAAQLRHRFESRAILFRVGSGDPLARNRIVNALLARHRSVEMVNENCTTPRGRRRPRDGAAAHKIAETRGAPVRDPLPVAATAGEVANLQRLSREGSGGRVTISRTSAQRVLRGEITLAEALDQALPKNRRGSAGGLPPSAHEPL